MFAPTRSHPRAPDKPPFETVVGLMTAPLDKVRDIFSLPLLLETVTENKHLRKLLNKHGASNETITEYLQSGAIFTPEPAQTQYLREPHLPEQPKEPAQGVASQIPSMLNREMRSTGPSIASSYEQQIIMALPEHDEPPMNALSVTMATHKHNPYTTLGLGCASPVQQDPCACRQQQSVLRDMQQTDSEWSTYTYQSL
ncbi:hypothetical protein Purlil1_12888 [Purpureocillium lilacinum]|uniref:Uncharacterized protein n=1 Tax=Purpureocillium lilacinum TaxID=33203 RepID=A0ABR0BFL3_PURLI|nr:hypothetical protein Purlil1_12888 [Purpureocillium lilacinum]